MSAHDPTSPYTTDPTFPDGSLRRYAGIHRPPYDPKSLDKLKRYPGMVTSGPSQRDYYENGYYDTPLYWLEPNERP